MSSEDKTRGCLTKAQTLRASGNYKDAVTALQSLSEHGVPWGPMYIAALDLLGELCFSQEQGVTVDRFLPAFRWNRYKLRGSQHLEEGTKRIVEITMKHLRALGERSQANAKAAEENPAEEDLIFAALSGVSPAQRAKERYLVPAENATQLVGNELLGFNAIGHSMKMLPIYLDTATELITYCQKRNLKRAIGRIADAFVRFFKRFLLSPVPSTVEGDNPHLIATYKELEADREDFYKAGAITERTVQVFSHLLQTLTSMNNWHAAWSTLQCFTRVMHEITQHPDPSRECQILANLAMAGVFWKCSHYAFHAHCLGLAAFLIDDKENVVDTASRAVLATLCAPNINREKKSFGRGSDSIFEKNARIAQLFGLQSAPAGLSLWQRLQRMEVLQRAHPEVQALDKLLRNELADEKVAKQAIEQLSVIVQKFPGLAMYEKPLRKVILQRYLECMAAQTTRVEASSLQIGETQASEEVYIHEIEPYILNESGISVEIDHKTGSISFSHTTKTRVLEAFTALAERVDRHPAAPRRKLDIRPEQLQRAHDRSSILHRLQHICEETAEARRQRAKEKEEEERENFRLERIQNEEKKKEAARLAQEARGLAEYQEHINQNRRKVALRRLQEKYKGFVAPATLIQKNSTEFVQELTARLTEHLKRTTQQKTADVTKMNHFERACREIEIPKRKAIELEEAEQHKAERAAARENFLIQHRKEFEKRQLDNEILKKFLKEAAVFAEQTQMKGKASKRDEQQMLLQKEKERLQGL
ncbi:uncharacterized protein Tco025E_03471 [Trypanosoma conorhini]|uniref:Eukaryotic translation initiation factor 3 subunit a n=1 Tax=Trypanosoma conorhini TaxID=83891 RepID=A0A422PUL8_9TRYP|nr:uncharacterized protein Tco025E_03471 [Trypanosoma conorhini]RNF21421.1 hypothetical protein Tco025E_03471 [Trypanosoma conorhini]